MDRCPSAAHSCRAVRNLRKNDNATARCRQDVDSDLARCYALFVTIGFPAKTRRRGQNDHRVLKWLYTLHRSPTDRSFLKSRCTRKGKRASAGKDAGGVRVTRANTGTHRQVKRQRLLVITPHIFMQRSNGGRMSADRGSAITPPPALVVIAGTFGPPAQFFVRSGPRGACSVVFTGAARYGRASYTMLNGVSAARRKRVNPAPVTTSRIRASPACAPSARPTSCASDDGVHKNVEAA